MPFRRIALTTLASVILFASACQDRYEQARQAGYQEGKIAGISEGDTVGFRRGAAKGLERGRFEGHDAGVKEGYVAGVKEGRDAGFKEGQEAGIKEGHAAGLNEGLQRGRESGRAEAQDAAREEGRKQGESAGIVTGKTAGIEVGKKIGYASGFDAGIQEGSRRATTELRSNFALRIGIPLIILALLVGLLLNLAGWRSLAALSDASVRLRNELEVRKRVSRERLQTFVDKRRNNGLAAPDVWLTVVALITFAAIEYKLHDELPIFLVLILVPLLGGIYALRSSPMLVARFTIFWVAASALVLDARYSSDNAWMREPAALAVILLAVYFLARGLFGTGWNHPLLEGAGMLESGLTVLAMLSVTLQIAWLLTSLVSLLAPTLLVSSVIGRLFASFLAQVRSLSPTQWFPAWVAVGAVLLAAAVRMSHDGFTPRPYDSLPPNPKQSLAATLIIIPKLPFWLLFNIFRFLIHYIKQVWETIRGVVNNYLVRLAYLLIALTLPCLCIIQGHALLQASAKTVGSYLHAQSPTPTTTLSVVVIQIVAAVLIYVVAIAFLPLEFESLRLRDVMGRIRAVVAREGAPATFVVGTVYAVFVALLIVSLPVVSLFPGAVSRGFFVWLCVGILTVAMIAFGVTAFRSPRTPTQA